MVLPPSVCCLRAKQHDSAIEPLHDPAGPPRHMVFDAADSHALVPRHQCRHNTCDYLWDAGESAEGSKLHADALKCRVHLLSPPAEALCGLNIRRTHRGCAQPPGTRSRDACCRPVIIVCEDAHASMCILIHSYLRPLSSSSCKHPSQPF